MSAPAHHASVGTVPAVGDRVRIDPHAADGIDEPVTITVTAVEPSTQERWVRLTGTSDPDEAGQVATFERLFIRVDLAVVLRTPSSEVR